MIYALLVGEIAIILAKMAQIEKFNMVSKHICIYIYIQKEIILNDIQGGHEDNEAKVFMTGHPSDTNPPLLSRLGTGWGVPEDKSLVWKNG